MRTQSLLFVPAALLALLTTSATSTPAGMVQSRPQSMALLPLTEKDEMRGGVGCSCTFVVGNRLPYKDLLMLAGNDLVTRTSAGVGICKMPATQVELIDKRGGGTARCGSRSINIRTVAAKAGNNDDSGADATVTIRDGKQSRVLKGAWACAC